MTAELPAVRAPSRGISFGGALDGVDASAGGWLRERHFDWAYWDFATDFGAFDVAGDTWRAPLREALLGPR